MKTIKLELKIFVNNKKYFFGLSIKYKKMEIKHQSLNFVGKIDAES
jgi:hypothetical protein